MKRIIPLLGCVGFTAFGSGCLPARPPTAHTVTKKDPAAEVPRQRTASAPEAGASKTVALTYWVVGAKAGGAETDPALAPIGASLRALSEEAGGLSFALVDRVAIQSSMDTRAFHEGQRTLVEQSLFMRHGQVVADVQIRTQSANVGPLHTRVPIVPDATVVVGETFLSDAPHERLFYVVHATVLEHGA